jgi:hypothetical protein
LIYDLAGTMGGGWANGNTEEDDVALTSDQRLRIQELKNRDSEFDQQLDQIGEGIQDLAEIAAMQGEEVKRQNVMLDNLGKRIDNVHDHVTTVNSKMKDTLTEVGRSSDKLCVDIICVVSANFEDETNISWQQLTGILMAFRLHFLAIRCWLWSRVLSGV